MKTTQQILFTILLIVLPCISGFSQDTGEELFSQAELDQMLAPIALYPDVLLSQVLMAATYPLEVVEASRWTRANPNLDGEAALIAVEDKDWDMSVKALVAYPELIQLMDENLTWTRQLGDAFLAQEEQVMETAQALRRRAMEEGSLDQLAHVTVEKIDQTIVIEPQQPEVIYVPYYSTRIVYGDWWWNDYPPFYWYPRSYFSSSFAFHWSRPFHISTRFYFSSCDWHRRHIVIHKHHRHPGSGHYDRDRSVAHRRDSAVQRDSDRWYHDPDHRRGVRYRDDRQDHRTARSQPATISRKPDLTDNRGAVSTRSDIQKRPDKYSLAEKRKEYLERRDSAKARLITTPPAERRPSVTRSGNPSIRQQSDTRNTRKPNAIQPKGGSQSRVTSAPKGMDRSKVATPSTRQARPSVASQPKTKPYQKSPSKAVSAPLPKPRAVPYKSSPSSNSKSTAYTRSYTDSSNRSVSKLSRSSGGRPRGDHTKNPNP